MRIIGIDPGYALVGWGVIDIESGGDIKVVDFGVISTDKTQEKAERLEEIYDDINQIVKQFNPDLSGIETLLFHRNITTAMLVSEARGVLHLAFTQQDIQVIDVNPIQVKNSISGYGKASKKQVQENVKMICGLGEVPKPDDAADALAVAITAFSLANNQSL